MPRLLGIDLVDTQTGMTHQVSAEELRDGRARGDYEVFCGARFLVASLTDPERGRCPECVS